RATSLDKSIYKISTTFLPGDGWYTTSLSKNFQGISGDNDDPFFTCLLLVYVSIPSLFVDEAKGYRHKVAYDAAKEISKKDSRLLYQKDQPIGRSMHEAQMQPAAAG
ncbi:hypothetical protein ACJX0J_040553, partial [Zea mays]